MSHNQINSEEWALEFGDDRDPDIEDRLYAQIYHSNTTYMPPPQEQSLDNDNYPNSSSNTETDPSNNALILHTPALATPNTCQLARKKRKRPLIDSPVNISNKLRRLQESNKRTDNAEFFASTSTVTESTGTGGSERLSSPVDPKVTETITEETVDNSKYAVTTRPQVKPIEATEDSDSEDSICEVPVPPKPLPPLIDIQDSDEETPVVMMNNEESSDEEPSKNDNEAPTASPDASIIIEDSDDSSDDDEIEAMADNIILNCTTVQKGVASLEELRRLTSSKNTIPIAIENDEESMTESETMYWKSFEGELPREFASPQSHASNHVTTSRDNNNDDNIRKNPDNSRPIGHIDALPSSSTSQTGTCEPGKSPAKEKSSYSSSKPREQTMSSKTQDASNCQENQTFQEYMLQPMPQFMIDYYNNPRGDRLMQDVREIQNSMPKDPRRWAILDEDMIQMPQERIKFCENCNRYGHTARTCLRMSSKIPVCYICGTRGHEEPQCPHNKLCINCGKKSHTFRRSCHRCHQFKCGQCQRKGHTSNQCPDNWRKYHQTTSGTKVNKPPNSQALGKPPNRLKCCNCAGKGHEITTCNRHRRNKPFINPNIVHDYERGPCYTPISSTQVAIAPKKVPKLPNASNVTLKQPQYQQSEPPQEQQTREPQQDNFSATTAECSDPKETVEIIPNYEQGQSSNVEQPGQVIANVTFKELFHFVNTTDPEIWSWQECYLMPYELTDKTKLYVNDVLILPNFLVYQFYDKLHCPMEVVIKGNTTQLMIILRMPDQESLYTLRVLLHQWLTRSPEDKKIIEMTTQRLPQECTKMLLILKSKILKFKKRTLPKRVLKLRKNLETAKGEALIDLKLSFMNVAYKYLLIDTPMDALKNFVDFYTKLYDLSCEIIPVPMYLSAYWYFFELFVPHYSPLIEGIITSWHLQRNLHQRGYIIYEKWVPSAFIDIKKDPTANRSRVSPRTQRSQAVQNTSPKKNSYVEEMGENENSPANNEIDTMSQPSSAEFEKAKYANDLHKVLEQNECTRIEKSPLKAQPELREDMYKHLYPDMPRRKDGHRYKKQQLLEYTQKALAIIRKENLTRSKILAKRMMKNKDTVASKAQLFTLWNEIRSEHYCSIRKKIKNQATHTVRLRNRKIQME